MKELKKELFKIYLDIKQLPERTYIEDAIYSLYNDIWFFNNEDKPNQSKKINKKINKVSYKLEKTLKYLCKIYKEIKNEI